MRELLSHFSLNKICLVTWMEYILMGPALNGVVEVSFLENRGLGSTLWGVQGGGG